MKIKGKDYRSVWMEGLLVKMIDQREIPHRFKIRACKDYRETAEAIKNMTIRGAPAIGAAACYGMAQGALSGDFEVAESVISKARPTAYDLFDAIKYFKANYRPGDDPKRIADAYADASAERCRKIGEHGEKLIKSGMRILTHCNAGALACVDWGTALAPMRLAHYNGKRIFVWVDETRPRLQGAKLTAWELVQERIDHALIADNAAGFYMARGKVDLVIVGADRIAANGDFANKIGTYEKAVLAKENGVPFYVAAPISTFDRNCKSSKDIVVEERGEEEIRFVTGLDTEAGGGIETVEICPKETRCENPAFDVTPAKFVTGFITERGILDPRELGSWT